jgi:DNA polymerase III subunit epsilon
MATFRPIFYDTETTGVKPDKDRVIEIAAFDPERNRSFERLINPGCPIPPEASAIHHITNDMVAGCPDFSQIGKEFIEFCEGDVVLIAHNNDNFDIHFLRNELSRHQIPIPSWKFFDTLKWARRYRPDLPRHTLQSLREVYGIIANNAHRALDDVIILHQVYSFMTDDLSINEIHALMNKPRALQHMPWGKYQGTPLSKIPKDYINWMKSNGVFEKPENSDLKVSIEKLGLFELAVTS